jgi:transcriptional antiterminator RfaH
MSTGFDMNGSAALDIIQPGGEEQQDLFLWAALRPRAEVEDAGMTVPAALDRGGGGPTGAREHSTRTWLCARTKPKHEHIAAATLSRNRAIEVFHPRLRMERATRRGMMRIIEPVFPCYLFVRCVAADQVEEIRYTTGISSLVRFGERIASVPDAVIEDLKQCFEAEEPMVIEDRLAAGTQVVVAEGSFLGFSGIVVRTLPATQRVQILLEFLGRTTLAEVDRRSLLPEGRCMADMMPRLARDRSGCVAASR